HRLLRALRAGVRLVVDHDGLDIAVLLDRGERLLGGRDAGESDPERVVERPRRRVQALDELLQNEELVVDDEDAADRLFHRVRRRKSGLYFSPLTGTT